MPARAPMTRAAMGVTKPAAGVTATRPATAPEAAPSTVGLPRELHSVSIQPRAAAAAAVLVVVNAWAASALAPSALPALNPNHPNHSRLAPMTVKGRLWGGMGCWPKPRRLPITSTAARADTPEGLAAPGPPARSRPPGVLANPTSPRTRGPA